MAYFIHTRLGYLAASFSEEALPLEEAFRGCLKVWMEGSLPTEITVRKEDFLNLEEGPQSPPPGGHVVRGYNPPLKRHPIRRE